MLKFSLSLVTSTTSLKPAMTAFAIIGSLAFTTLSLNGALAAAKVGTSAAVRGDVFVSTKGANRKAQVRDAIRLQDKVLTKDDSALQILLLDRSTFTVGQNCNMIIDRFVYDPDTASGQIGAKVTKGAFRFMSGRIGKKNPTNASVSTPSATIGIRGTFFEGVVGEDAVALAALAGIDTSNANLTSASIAILRGPGRNRNSLDRVGIINVSNSAGSALISKPDFAVFTPSANAAPIGPFRMTPEMQSYLDFFLRSEPNGPNEKPLDLDATGSEFSGQVQFQTPVDPLDRPDDTNTDPEVPENEETPMEETTPPEDNTPTEETTPPEGNTPTDTEETPTEEETTDPSETTNTGDPITTDINSI